MVRSRNWPTLILALAVVACVSVPDETATDDDAPTLATVPRFVAPGPASGADAQPQPAAAVVPDLSVDRSALPGDAFAGTTFDVVAVGEAEAVVLTVGDGDTGLVVIAPSWPTGPGSCGQIVLDAYHLARQAPPENIQAQFLFPADGQDGIVMELAMAATDVAPAGVVNLGGCAGENGIGVWDADGPAERSLVMDALIQAGDSEGVAAGFAARPAGAPTHHRDFQAAGIAAVGLTLPSQTIIPASGGSNNGHGAQLLARAVSVFDAFVGGATRP